VGIEDEIILLGKSKSRHALAEKSLQKGMKMTFSKAITDFRRDSELFSIAKFI
jgi:hypothetical protein